MTKQVAAESGYPATSKVIPKASCMMEASKDAATLGSASGDLVSIYLGAAGVPWGAYLTGGVLGSFPRVLAATLLGAALWEFGSPRFFLSLLPGAALTLLSLVLWRAWR